MSWWGGGRSVYSTATTSTATSNRRRPKGGIDTGTDVVVKLRLYERARLKGRGESALVQYILQHPKVEGMQVTFTCRREQLQDALNAIAENPEDLLNTKNFQFESLGEMVQTVVETSLGVKMDDDVKESLTGKIPSVRPDKGEHPSMKDPWSAIRSKGKD